MIADSKSNVVSSGVQELINRLRVEGIASGQSEAERMLAEARIKSMEMLDAARAEAETILSKARSEAQAITEKGEEALRLASRDVMLKLREACNEEFRHRMKRLVSHKLADPKLLEGIILEIAARSRPSESARQMKVLLPPSHVSKEELSKEVSNVQPGSLAAFVLGLSADVLREGLSFEVSDDPSPGVHVQIVDDDVQLELNDQTLTALLLQYLVPRYRAVLEKDA